MQGGMPGMPGPSNPLNKAGLPQLNFPGRMRKGFEDR